MDEIYDEQLKVFLKEEADREFPSSNLWTENSNPDKGSGFNAYFGVDSQPTRGYVRLQVSSRTRADQEMMLLEKRRLGYDRLNSFAKLYNKQYLKDICIGEGVRKNGIFTLQRKKLEYYENSKSTTMQGIGIATPEVITYGRHAIIVNRAIGTICGANESYLIDPVTSFEYLLAIARFINITNSQGFTFLDVNPGGFALLPDYLILTIIDPSNLERQEKCQDKIQHDSTELCMKSRREGWIETLMSMMVRSRISSSGFYELQKSPQINIGELPPVIYQLVDALRENLGSKENFLCKREENLSTYVNEDMYEFSLKYLIKYLEESLKDQKGLEVATQKWWIPLMNRIITHP